MENYVRKTIEMKLKDSESWPHIEGQMAYYGRIREIYQAILDGATLDDLRPMFDAYIPASLSQVGAWLPREIHEHLGRITDHEIIIVKTAGFKAGQTKVYQDSVKYYDEHGEWPNEDDEMIGSECICIRCGDIYATKEAAHQIYCPGCAARKPKRRAKGKKLGISKMPKGQKISTLLINKIIRANSMGDEKEANIRLVMLNDLRMKEGREELSIDQIKSSDNPTSLI